MAFQLLCQLPHQLWAEAPAGAERRLKGAPLRQRRDLQRRAESPMQADLSEEAELRGGANHHHPVALLGLLLQKAKQQLQDIVGKALADAGVVNEPLDIVQHDQGQRRLVCILEGAPNGLELHLLCLSSKAFPRNAADEGEVGQLRDMCRQCRLPTPMHSMEERGRKQRARTRAGLADVTLQLLQQVCESGHKGNDALSRRRLLQRTRVLPEGRLDLLQGQLEVGGSHHDAIQILRGVQVVDVHFPAHGRSHGCTHQGLQLRTGKVSCPGSQVLQAHAGVKEPPLLQLGRVNLEDLEPTGLVGKADLHVKLQASRTEERWVQELFAVGHPDQEHVI
mmetsp:Transcript_54933/g.131209  ORF Transcript_54933/g.131209 Transcript_54933/m.131209 type:complete len:336 (-) Transcript_54933:1166-2173(-)